METCIRPCLRKEGSYIICYRDMTFCPFYKDCKSNIDCHRALTPEVLKAAKEYGLGVDQFSDLPECFEPRVGFKLENDKC